MNNITAHHWFPMGSAPRNGHPVLLRFKPEFRPTQPELERWYNVVFVGRHTGILDGGFDIGWQFASPVGCGGFPDDWFTGWRYLPDDEYLVNETDPWPGFRPTHRCVRRSFEYQLLGQTIILTPRLLFDMEEIVVYNNTVTWGFIGSVPGHALRDPFGHLEQTGTAMIQSADAVKDEATLVMYRDAGGQMWARPVAEFNDGRFVRINEASPA